MSVLRRLYNVAYGKVRSWQPAEGTGESEETERVLPRYRTEAAGAIAALKERLGQLEAEAEVMKGTRTERAQPTSKSPDLEAEDERAEEEQRPTSAPGPRQRQL